MSLQLLEPINKRILDLDIFTLLGLADLSQTEKDLFLKRMNKLAIDLFLLKLTGQMKPEIRRAVVDKYADVTELDDEGLKIFIKDITNHVPDASDLFVDSLAQVKASLVQDHYKTKRLAYESLLLKTMDKEKRALIEEQIEKCKKNEEMAANGQWDAVTALVELA